MDISKVRHVFASRIRKLRDGKMNQGEFAESIGISKGAMSYYEQELRTPDIGVLRTICETHGTSADYLLGLLPDPDRSTADVCIETGLSPQAARRLRLLKKLSDTAPDPDIITAVMTHFGTDAQEVLELIPFTSAVPVVSLLLSCDEGLNLLNFLSAIVFEAELVTGSEEQPYFRLSAGHKNMSISFLPENLTTALWVNIQREAEALKRGITPLGGIRPEE